MSTNRTHTVTSAHIGSRALAVLVAAVLAFASMVALGQPAQADPVGISSTVLLNGEKYNGIDIVNRGDTVTLRVSYNRDLDPSVPVVFEIPGGVDNVSMGEIPLNTQNNSAIKSIVPDGNKITITFWDPLPVHEGTFDLKLKIAADGGSVQQPIKWTINGEEHSRIVIIRKPGDTFEQLTGAVSKTIGGSASQTVTFGSSDYTVDDAGTITLTASGRNKTVNYALTYENNTADPKSVEIEDILPSGLSLVTGTLKATLSEWDDNGLNKTDQALNAGTTPTFDPATTAGGFSATVNLPKKSKLVVNYSATIAETALTALLQTAYDNYVTANGTAPGYFPNDSGFPLKNNATLGDQEKTATANIRGQITGVDVGNAFAKSADWTGKIVKTDADGKLDPPAPITYTLKADLREWNGSGTNFPLLTQNVVISDELPAQASWNTTDPDFVTVTTSTGGTALTTLTKLSTCPADISLNDYVGQYCVDGQKLLINVGKATATNLRIKVKALLNNTTGLAKTGGATENDPTTYTLPNDAYFDYGATTAAKRSASVKVTVMPETEGGIHDTSAFSKASGSGAISVNEGERATIPYTFVVGAGKGVDPRTSTIVDHFDRSVFDMGDDFDAVVEVSGTYNRAAGSSSGGVVLTADDFVLGIEGTTGDLVIALSEAGKAKITAQGGADKRWAVTVKLRTKPLTAQQTLEVVNKASLRGEDDETLYWDDDEKEATSFGNEAEVRKRLYDRGAGVDDPKWVEKLTAVTKLDDTLAQKTYVYRVEYLPRGDWGVNPTVAKISSVVDKLPAGVEFLGFVTEANAPTGANPDKSDLKVGGGNVWATYNAVANTVTLESRDGQGNYDPSKPVAAYLAVKIGGAVEAGKAITNTIDYTGATVEPLPQPSIDIEKWTDEGPDDQQNPSGPVYDGFGHLSQDNYRGDFDSAPGKVLKLATPQSIRFTVSNDGGEALEDVKVSDELVDGVGTITGLTCNFSLLGGPATGTTWEEGPFLPGDQFECTGTLPAMSAGKTHHDRAKVTGVGIVSKDEVKDQDDWHGYVKSYAVGDYVWIDTNRDGIQDENESPLEGVKVELLDKDGKAVLDEDDQPLVAYTDPEGRYLFDDLAAGSYQVRFTLTEQQAKIYQFTLADTGDDDESADRVDSDANPATGLTKQFTLDDTNEQLVGDYDRPFKATEGVDPTWDAGVNLKKVSVGDYVWVDTDRDGRQDKGEPGIPGVVLKLVGPDGQPVTDVYGKPVGPVTTDKDGKYTFEDLPALVDDQAYKVVIDRVASEEALKPYVPTKPTVGDRAGDSSTWEASTVPGDLHDDGDRDPTLDFGFVTKSYAIGDYVWIDKNNDGKQGGKEKPLAGVKVELIKDGKVIATTKTDAKGHYLFDNLPAGTYQVKFTLTKAQKKQYVFTKADVGSKDSVDSDANKKTGLTKTFVLDDSNTALTTTYSYAAINATQGIDPTWDAGVVSKDSLVVPPTKPVVTGLPSTGNPVGWGDIAGALALITAGGVLLVWRRRKLA